MSLRFVLSDSKTECFPIRLPPQYMREDQEDTGQKLYFHRQLQFVLMNIQTVLYNHQVLVLQKMHNLFLPVQNRVRELSRTQEEILLTF